MNERLREDKEKGRQANKENKGPFVDRVLQKAVEHLRQQLDKSSAAAAVPE